MKIFRWEVWAVGLESGDPFEDRVSRHLTYRGARRAAAVEPTRITAAAIGDWNRRWPRSKLTRVAWQVRRAS